MHTRRSTARTRTVLREDDASAEHRRKLEALFSGSANSESSESAPVLRHPPRQRQVFAAPRKSLGRSPSEYRLRLERLRIAREVEEIVEAGDAFLAHHQLPDDVDVLYKLLLHPSEKVMREAMGQLSSLMMQGRLQNTVLLEDRLNTMMSQVTEDATRSYVEGLLAQIAAAKQKSA
jgi:hypothetical protein